MGYALGIDVGTSFTAAAIWRSGDQQANKAEVMALGSRMPSVSSVLFLGADGSVVVGEAAERRAQTDPDRVIREFKRRIGDDTPLVVGGRPYAAHDLAAMMVRWVVDRVVEREGGPPDRIAVTHPAGWGPYKKDLLSGALRSVGLGDLIFLAEPEAAAVSYAVLERVEVGTAIAVYDLGGGTFDAAVVRKTGMSSFELLGSADGLEELGGADFDEAVFAHVQAGLGAQLDGLDLEDPGVLGGLARLRRECTEAKEALSADTVVSIPVLLPGINSRVRLVRSEFEDMIRPALEETVESLSRAIRSAGLNSGDLGAVLLVGGSSRVPLVSQLVSARLGCPVVVDADPKTTIALGAAVSMAPQAPPAATAAGALIPDAGPPNTGPPNAGDADPGSFAPSGQPRTEVSDYTPERPQIIPAQRGFNGRREEFAGDDAPSGGGILTKRLRNIVGGGVLAGLLVTAFAVAAPLANDPTPTNPSTNDSPVSVDPPEGGGEVPGSGGGSVKSPDSNTPRGQKTPDKVTPTPTRSSGTATPTPAPTPPPTPGPTPKPTPEPSPKPSPNPSPSPSPKPSPSPSPSPSPPPPSPSPSPSPPPS